jgi:hypothetical protein
LLAVIVVISFLRGLLINHDTPPSPAENQSNPIAPEFTVYRNPSTAIANVNVVRRLRNGLEISGRKVDG